MRLKRLLLLFLTYFTNFPSSSNSQSAPCVYEDDLFTAEVITRIENHPVEEPMFLFWSTHSIHGPLEVSSPFYEKFSFIDDTSVLL